MSSKYIDVIDSAIWVIFLALAIVTPLIFTTQTTELYEVPKMFFVYLAATILLFLTLIKFVLQEKIEIPKNLVLSLFGFFLIVQIISTIFSIDKFTSIFGFPTRLNGGLLSQFAYFVIFAAAIINLTSSQAKKLLVSIVITTLTVALWGIPGHFGRDPSCLVLTGQLTSSCWQKEFDPTARIFSTLGQPNWLASYLVLVIPLAVSIALAFKNQRAKILFLGTSVILFWALTLTNSRAGALAACVSLIIYLVLLGAKTIKNNLGVIAVLIALFFLIGIYFGTGLKSRIGEAISSGQHSAFSIQRSAPTEKPTQSALTSGGTESGQIRLIVWRGAIDIFKHSPVFGSGPETFVSSYFMFRPAAHNQTTEWEFFYNKAHNEFLNYLANTGIVGFAAYLMFIVTICIALLRLSKSTDLPTSLFAKGVFAGFVGYLISIFFGFSVVATQTILFLMLGTAFKLEGEGEKFAIDLRFLNSQTRIWAAIVIILLVGLFFVVSDARLYLSDVLEKRANDFKDTSPNKTITAYKSAIATSPTHNPYLLFDYSNSLATYASGVENTDDAKKLANEADTTLAGVINPSANNFLLVQKLTKTYILIANIDPIYGAKAQDLGEKLTHLAPTYPISFLTRAKVQIVLDQKEKAVKSLEQALALKPDYVEAQELLGQLNSK